MRNPARQADPYDADKKLETRYKTIIVGIAP
jgi:hypothetical protein